MKLSIVIYDGFTSLDAIGAYEVLSRIPGMEVEWIAATKGVMSPTRAASAFLRSGVSTR